MRDEAERITALTSLFLLVGEEPTAERLDLFAEAVESLPLPWLKRACAELRKVWHWQRVPLPGDILAAAQELAGIGKYKWGPRGLINGPQAWPPSGYHYDYSGQVVQIEERPQQLGPRLGAWVEARDVTAALVGSTQPKENP